MSAFRGCGEIPGLSKESSVYSKSSPLALASSWGRAECVQIGGQEDRAGGQVDKIQIKPWLPAIPAGQVWVNGSCCCTVNSDSHSVCICQHAGRAGWFCIEKRKPARDIETFRAWKQEGLRHQGA